MARKRSKSAGTGKGQRGNLNALRNGSRLGGRIKRYTVGELPRTMIAVKREGCKYRRDLEVEVLRVKGEISTTDAHLIDTAAAATIQAGICRWLLRHKIETMSTSDIRGCTSDIVKAKERRDASVKALNLNAPPPDPWATIDAPLSTNGEAETAN